MLTVRSVLKSVSKRSGHSVQDILTCRDLVIYRQIVSYVSNQAGRSSVHIAHVLSKNHKTVLYSINRIARKMGTDAALRAFIEQTMEELSWNAVGAPHASSAQTETSMAFTDAALMGTVCAPMTLASTGNPQTQGQT